MASPSVVVFQACFSDSSFRSFVGHSVCFLFSYVTCACVDPNQWFSVSVVLPDTNKVIEAPLCNRTDQCYREALNRFQAENWIWESYCFECLPQCSTTYFFTQISSLPAPPDWMMNEIKVSVEASLLPLPENWSREWKSEIEKNYVAVVVVCETTQVDNYTQIASISGVDLLSNIGGHTSLWIGISFLSIMELVEMLYRLIRYHFYILRRNVAKN